MKLSRLQSSGLAVFAFIYDKVSFLFCSDKALPPGLRVASAGCPIVGSLYSSLFSGLRSIEVSTKAAAKKEAHLLAQSLWNREWVCSNKGSITRAFFPTPESRGRITDMDLIIKFFPDTPSSMFTNTDSSSKHRHTAVAATSLNPSATSLLSAKISPTSGTVSHPSP